jgi:hypothetical protein
MQPRRLLPALRIPKPAALLLAFLSSAFALSVVGLVSSTAQSPEKDEREIEDMIPKHLPVKVKVKNIEKIKDLKNEKWARDFELEVENTSDRPIYYLNFGMYVPEVKAPDGTAVGFTFRYGRVNLSDYTVLAGPDDIPLLPGATYVFKLTQQNLKGWELIRAEHPNPKKLRLKLHYLHFGDGTGLLGPDGTPVGGKEGI